MASSQSLPPPGATGTAGSPAPSSGPGAAAGRGAPPTINEDINMNLPASVFFPPVTPEQFALLPHDDQGPHLLAAAWALTGLSALFLGTRLYCKLCRGTAHGGRRGGLRGLWWDDYILTAAWVCLAVSSILHTVNVVVGGYGKHLWDVGSNYTIGVIIDTFLRLNIISTLTTTASVWTKTSFALTLVKLCDGWTRRSIWAAIVLMNAIMLVACVLPWTRCKPISATWNFLQEELGQCLPIGLFVGYNTFATSSTAAVDIILALLPWKIIWDLQMKKIEKIGVGVAMSCGLFAGAVTIVKAVKTQKMSTVDPVDQIDLSIWTTTEVAVTIIAASIPILRVLLRDVHSTARRYYLSRSGGVLTGRDDIEKSNISGSSNGNRSPWANSHVTATVASTKLQDNLSNSRLDNWSDKSILGDAAPTGRIKQTREVNVEYREMNSSEGTEFELAPVARRA